MTVAFPPLRSLGARHLPRPGAERFRPLRAGIRNVWEYDNQEFWFADGRLILRGANTAGKSKALELLLPFVLDGETRPERLDPFGARSKTMYWNLIEFDDERRYEIGYCWIEFGRVDDSGLEHFVTCIVGLRANRNAGRKVETWFAVTPLRIGDQLDLAPDARPLPPERLREALDGRGRFSGTARDHRGAVDHALFQLGPERYEALLHLLLQLRRPKLSEKLDPTKLADVLTEALPPLEPARLELLAQGFARLDAEQSELESLEAARDELAGFLDHYRSYARVQGRIRADAVRSANNRFDDVTRVERRQREAFERAGEELEVVEGERQQLDRDRARLEGQLQGLDLSKVQHAELVEQRAAEAERVAGGSRARASADERLTQEAEAEAGRLVAESDERCRERDGALDGLARLSGPAGMEVALDAHRHQLAGDPVAGRRALDGAADRRRAVLAAVREAQSVYRSARDRLDRAQERADEAEETLSLATAAAAASSEAATAAVSAYAAAADGWAARLDAEVADLVQPGTGLGERALDAVTASGASEASAQQLAEDLCAGAAEEVARRRVAVHTEIQRSEEGRAGLVAERDRVAAERDDAPPAAPGRPDERAEGVPLWACTDFSPALSDGQRANLEAALHAAGLLDAVVTADGRLVDATTLDTVIVPGRRAAQSLSEWLLPDPAAAPTVPTEAVAAVLDTIGSGETPDHPVWAGTDGRWANGPLAGRWSKTEAEYVGASARAAARARRIEVLDRRIADLDEVLGDLAGRAGTLADLAGRVAAVRRSFPSPSGLRDALRDEVRLAQERDRRAETAERLHAALDEAQAAASAAEAALHDAERAAGCDAARLDAVVAALAAWREALVGVAAAVEAARRAEVSATRARARWTSARHRADETAAVAARDAQEAAGRRGEADELRRTEGADVDAILARKAALEGAVGAAIDGQTALAARRDEVRDRLKEAETRLAATEAEREEKERARAASLTALSRFADTELAVLALGAVDSDRELTQVTAGLAFARTAAERLGDVATDQRAQDTASNRLHASFSDLRSKLAADFDPHLDTSDGLALCFAKLNGVAVGAGDLAVALDEQVRRRRETLSSEERDLIERHLLAEVGGHLGDRVHAAWSHIRRMNDQLSEHPTASGVTLRLEWEADPEAGPGAVEALRLLRRDVHLLDATERATLAAFLADRVRTARDDSEGADAVERMGAALDYRRWHRFTVVRRANGRDERFTSRTQGRGSGGEQAKLAHMPLFAATAGYYATAAPTAPRLLVLDEAFAGIDDSQRADCMGMLVELGLDVVLTNYAEWGCYPQVPSVAVYHLERIEGQRGVAAIRFVWDGARRREDDPFLDSIEQPHEGLFGES